MPEKEGLIELINIVFKRIGENESKYSEIKEELQGKENIPSEVVAHLTKTLSNYDITVLPKVFDLLDYLSGKCPEKLSKLLNSEEFLEKLLLLSYEPLYKTKILSLVKYWSLVYEKQLSDYPHLKEFITNLKSCEIELPSVPILLYCEKKWSDANHNQAAQPYIQEPDEENQRNYYGPYLPEGFNVTVPAAMGTDAAGMNINPNPAGYPPPNSNYYLGAAAQPIAQRPIYFDPQNQSVTMYFKPKTQVADIMELEELIYYKTEQCQYGQNCTNKPTNSYTNSFRNESLLCVQFHGSADKRRPLYGKQTNGNTNQFEYSAKQCQNPSCNPDYCNLAHGFFEFRFHPENYKLNECNRSVAPACIAGKYCPFYHNQNERRAWNNTLSHYFGIHRGDWEVVMSDETQVTIYDPNVAAHYNDQFPSLQEAQNKTQQSSHNNSSPEKKTHNQNGETQEKIVYIDVKSKLIKLKTYIDPEKLKDSFFKNLTFSPFIDPETLLKGNNASVGSKLDVLSSTSLKEKYNTAKNFAPKYC